MLDCTLLKLSLFAEVEEDALLERGHKVILFLMRFILQQE